VQLAQKVSRWVQAAGKLRRYWLTHFRRGYVARQMQLREGSCRRCGRCCALLFRCPWLEGRATCRIYGLRRPRACEAFPIDERDIGDVGGECGFSFPVR
jgi:hypothetical protein